MAANVTLGVNPADPTGRTIRFTTTGADGQPITWRWGDCTDHKDEKPEEPIDHTYNGDGVFTAIGHVGATGQRLILEVIVPGS